MRKITKKLIITLLITAGLVSLWPPMVFARTTTVGSVKGIFDAFRSYKQKTNPKSWEELRSEWSDLKDLKKEINNEAVNKEVQFLLISQERFINFVNRLIDYLTQAKERVKNDPALDEATKTEIIAEIDQHIAWLNSKKTEIAQAQSLEELRKIVQEIRTYWQKYRFRVRARITKVANLKFRRALERLEQLISRVEEKIATLKEMGYDTSEAERLLEEAKADLEKAKQEYEKAIEILSNLPEDNPQPEIQKARQHIRKAVAYLRSAVKKIKAAIQSLKKQRPPELPKPTIIPNPSLPPKPGPNPPEPTVIPVPTISPKPTAIPVPEPTVVPKPGFKFPTWLFFR